MFTSTLDDVTSIDVASLSLSPSPSLPLLPVRSMVAETERLVESRRLLEAHARLTELECWQDDILWQLSGAALSPEDQQLVLQYFSGVGRLVEALGTSIYEQEIVAYFIHYFIT